VWRAPARGPRSTQDRRLPLSATTSSPSPTPAMSAQTLELLIIVYGSRDTDTLGEERYGADQRRLEIALRPKLPRAGMNPMEISEWANLWCSLHYKNMKHRCVSSGSNRVEDTQRMVMPGSQKWCCEFCSTSCCVLPFAAKS
jgi:hypothetical protein